MHTTDLHTRRILLRLALLPPAAWLVGCGGSEQAPEPDPSAQPAKSAQAVDVGSPVTVRPRRKARRLLRNGVTSIAIAGDGSIGVSTSNGAISVFDLNDNNLLLRKTILPAGEAPAASLVFSEDGSRLLAVGSDSTVRGWNVASGQRQILLSGHESAVRAVAMIPDGRWIVTGGEETRILVWNARTARLRSVLSGHTDFVNTLSFSNDGNWLASGDAVGRILLWQITSGRLLNTLRGHAGELNSLSFAPDNNLLASSAADGKVLLWDPAAGLQVGALQGQASPVNCLAFNRNGKVLAGGTDDGSLVVWRTSGRQVLQLDVVPGGAVNAVQFDPRNPNRIVLGGEDGQIRLALVNGNAGS